MTELESTSRRKRRARVEVFGDDRVGVLRAVGRDVLDRLVEVRRRRAPRGSRRGIRCTSLPRWRPSSRGTMRARFVVAAQLDALARGRSCASGGSTSLRDAARDQQRFHRVAGAEALRLRVVGDAQRLVEVGLVVDVDVAHAVQVLDHRDARLAHQPLDQALAAARHDHVDVVLHGDELADRRAVGGLDHLHRGFGQSGRLQAFVHARGDRLVGVDRFRAAAQDRRVAGLEAQPGGVGGHVRARFVNDADHAERHAHLPDLDAGRAVAQVR